VLVEGQFAKLKMCIINSKATINKLSKGSEIDTCMFPVQTHMLEAWFPNHLLGSDWIMRALVL
jgi:hypothetical protein